MRSLRRSLLTRHVAELLDQPERCRSRRTTRWHGDSYPLLGLHFAHAQKMVLGSEPGIRSLRNVEEMEQYSVKRGQGGGCSVPYAGEVERDERDRPQSLKEVVAGWAGRDVAGEQVGDLADRAKGASGGAFEQAEDHQRDAQDRDQPNDALIAGHKEGTDSQGTFRA